MLAPSGCHFSTWQGYVEYAIIFFFKKKKIPSPPSPIPIASFPNPCHFGQIHKSNPIPQIHNPPPKLIASFPIASMSLTSPPTPPSPIPIAQTASFDTADGVYDLAWSESHDSLLVAPIADGSVKLYDTAIADNSVKLYGFKKFLKITLKQL